MITPPSFFTKQLTQAYKNACLAELEALKPGNVHMFADGHGMTIQDFIKSAEVSSSEITKKTTGVGGRIINAIRSTQEAVGLNTNLGLVLLCAPLIHSAYQAYGSNQHLKESLFLVLNELTIQDAQLTAQAIVIAKPAGLGCSAEHDVLTEPKVTLLQMMQFAQHKDRIAWQYAHQFSDVFEYGVQRYQQALNRWGNQAWATTALYLSFMAKYPDTHIMRKYGESLATDIQKEAEIIEEAYWLTDNPKLIQKRLLYWDESLKNRKINPGTSADFTVASILAALILPLLNQPKPA
jgi:triphosphoribosyl-dephospho-CoA synthase